jgi:ribonucleoside-diphosphate reductase alpha chain
MLTANAIQILEDRYLLKDSKGNLLETPDQLFKRVADFIGGAEPTEQGIWKSKFYELLKSLAFLPNSPTLMNAGLPKGQLSACFALPIEDSLEGIFKTLKDAALIHQSGGGTGFNFSRLRSKEELVSSTGGSSSGPVAFIKLYDMATEQVKQGGKRRGANMGILNISHPDIAEFISSKNEGADLRNFNLSVGMTNDFLKTLKEDGQWPLRSPHTPGLVKHVSAKALWKSIVHQAWKTGDPGLLFLDTINKYNPTPFLGPIESTNPCGEVPLLDYESCNLGSLNLTKMLKPHNHQWVIDWDKLASHIALGIRFLDNVITRNHYVLAEIKKMSLANRKIGLGVMGWAALLLLLEIPYASDEAVALAEKLMAFIKTKSHEASAALAREKGCFPNWDKSILPTYGKIRNATCNSIAPTGTISVIANTTYSIEPLYALAFKRSGILGDQTQQETNMIFVTKMKAMGLWSPKLQQEVLSTGSIQHIEGIPPTTKELFRTSLEIPWEYHLRHQQAFQKHTDNAVSKTVNLPKETSVETVSAIYLNAWEMGLKGITIYREGSKEEQVLQACSLNGSISC